MIKVYYKQLHMRAFQIAWKKLTTVQMKDPIALKIGLLNKHVQKASADSHEELMEIKKKYEVKDQSLTEKAESYGLPFPCAPGQEDAVKAALEKWENKFFEFQHSAKITLDFLISVSSWSPAELEALEPFVTELSAVK